MSRFFRGLGSILFYVGSVLWILWCFCALPLAGAVYGGPSALAPSGGAHLRLISSGLTAAGGLFCLMHVSCLLVLGSILEKLQKALPHGVFILLAPALMLVTGAGAVYLTDALSAGFTVPSFGFAATVVALAYLPVIAIAVLAGLKNALVKALFGR